MSKRDDKRNIDGDNSGQDHHPQKTRNRTPSRLVEKLEASKKQVTKMGQDLTRLLEILDEQNPSTMLDLRPRPRPRRSSCGRGDEIKANKHKRPSIDSEDKP
ncbi:unnamed protein product, partial [Citrullus colocynthis]